MKLDPEHNDMLTALADASAREREVTASCPEGISRWHTAQRLMTEAPGLDGWTATDVHRIGAALQRRGLAAHKTLYGITRWTLTEHGAREARRLARLVQS